MNHRYVPLPHFALYCLIMVLATPLGVHAQGIYIEHDALVPGYRLPNRPDYEAPFRKALNNGGLRLAERNKVYHFVQLDMSPRNWADNILRVVVGFNEHWTPKDYYAALPAGYKEEPNRAVVFMSTRKIKFPGKLEPNATEPLRSISDPRYTLERLGDRLVLSKGAERRWYFESPDQGKSWRIAQIEDIRVPGCITKMQYLNDQIVAVQYPNGEQATIEYDAGLPVRIVTPFGQRAEITRAAGGRISNIQIFREDADQPAPANPSRRGPDDRLVQSYAYGHDGEGRISAFTDAMGNRYEVSYRFEKKSQANATRIFHTSRITNLGDGGYQERIHEENPNDKTWSIRDHYGRGEGRKATEAELANAVRMKAVNRRWVVVGQARGDAKAETNIDLDPKGLPRVTVGPTGLTQTTQHDESGNIVKVVESDGHAVVKNHNDFGQVTRRTDSAGRETLMQYDEHGRLLSKINSRGQQMLYEYAADGFLSVAQLAKTRYEFDIDRWGRIKSVSVSGKGRLSYDYDRFGKIKAISRTPARNLSQVLDDAEPQPQVTTYHYDTRGRVIGVAYPDGSRDKIDYNREGRLLDVELADGEKVRYRFDRAGRMSVKQGPGRSHESWSYHANDQAEIHRVRQDNAKGLSERMYDLTGNLIATREGGERPAEHQHNDLGQLIRTDYPDKTFSTYTYDARGRLISVRGNHSEPADYTYVNGRRVTTPAGEANP